MDINPIQESQIGAAPKPKIVTDPNDGLGKDDFLKLLLAQLKNQDPTKPMEDKDFIVQLAQFRSLEQMQETNSNLQTLLDFQQFSLASGLIGKSVEAKVDGRTVEGTVSDVHIRADQVLLTVDGTEVDLAAVNRIELAPVSAGSQE